jgi:hypothetical protein
MSTNEEKLAAATPPSTQMIGPNQQGVFEISNENSFVSVDNNDADSDSVFLHIWIYASETAVTPTRTSIPSAAIQTLRPPGRDGLGNKVRTLVIYNIGNTQLTCVLRTN